MAWKRVVLAAKTCDVLLSIGTSGVVFPAAEIPSMALRAGAYVVHINPMQAGQPGIALSRARHRNRSCFSFADGPIE